MVQSQCGSTYSQDDKEDEIMAEKTKKILKKDPMQIAAETRDASLKNLMTNEIAHIDRETMRLATRKAFIKGELNKLK